MPVPRLIQGDCLRHLPLLPDNSLHAICTDPPYGLVEFSSGEVAKLRAGRGGVWRIPPKWDGCERRPLPRFTVLTPGQKDDIEGFFTTWANAVLPKLRPGGHVLIAGNPMLQMYVQRALVAAGFENRATILRVYHGFRGGDRPKNAEREFPGVCVSPRGNYEPWMLFRKSLSERTVADNLRRWETGGLRMLKDDKPLPDVIASFKTPLRERDIADHPSLKPQHLLRVFVRALLPLGGGVILDPFMGSGSTVAAAAAVGAEAIGIEIDPAFFAMAEAAVPRLAALYPAMTGERLEWGELNGSAPRLRERSLFPEPRSR
ncbi:MAG: site-specific DNA-methyltransferase [Planctomycetes bacterium]|nr:site-specific DNA-methyltransferase [Planctomycetota bacterium]